MQSTLDANSPQEANNVESESLVESSEGSDGTLGLVAGAGSGAIAGGLIGAAVGGPAGALLGAAAGGALGAAGGEAAAHIGDDLSDDVPEGDADATDVGMLGIAATGALYGGPMGVDAFGATALPGALGGAMVGGMLNEQDNDEQIAQIARAEEIAATSTEKRAGDEELDDETRRTSIP